MKSIISNTKQNQFHINNCKANNNLFLSIQKIFSGEGGQNRNSHTLVFKQTPCKTLEVINYISKVKNESNPLSHTNGKKRNHESRLAAFISYSKILRVIFWV